MVIKNGAVSHGSTDDLDGLPVLDAKDLKIFSGLLTEVIEKEDETTEIDRWCVIQNLAISLYSDEAQETLLSEFRVADLKLVDDSNQDKEVFILQLKKEDENMLTLKSPTLNVFENLIEILWYHGAQLESNDDSVAATKVRSLELKKKRKSQPREIDIFEKEAEFARKMSIVKELREPTENEGTKSEGEASKYTVRQKLDLPGMRSVTPDSDAPSIIKSRHRASAVLTRKPNDSRMSSFFRSLTMDRRKKSKPAISVEDLTLPKDQFHGIVREILKDDNGTKQLVERHCKVSGKIFYAFANSKDLKPMYKAPLRNATIEEIEKDKDGLGFTLTNMETGKTFSFIVNSEEESERWFAALYMIEPKPNRGGSSRESLLDDKAEETGNKRESGRLLSNSTSSSSLSSTLSRQPKSPTGSTDELKNKPVKKNSKGSMEDQLVPPGNRDTIKHTGYMFEVISSQLSTTKVRRWCVLTKSFLEVYTNKTDKNPVKGIVIDQFMLVPATEESKGKKTIQLKSENELHSFVAHTEKEYDKWFSVLRKATKKRSRMNSESAKSALKSTGDTLKNLLSVGYEKKDSKRNTMILNERDENAVKQYSDVVDSGSSISGLLTVYSSSPKLRNAKERFCKIQNGLLYIAKRSKPEKTLIRLDLSNVAILDECDLDKDLFKFRLDYDDGKSVTVRTKDQDTAERWMVAISMAMLLQRFQSGTGSKRSSMEHTRDFKFDTFDDSENNTSLSGSPLLGRPMSGFDLSGDIRKEIEKKVSGGEMELTSVHDFLRSTFPSGSKDNLLDDDDDDDKAGSRKTSDTHVYTASKAAEAQKQNLRRVKSEGVPLQHKNLSTPSKGSEKLNSSHQETRVTSTESVFAEPSGTSQVELELQKLFERKDLLESERYTMMKCMPELRDLVEESKERKKGVKTFEHSNIAESEYLTTKTDFDLMKKRFQKNEAEIKLVIAEILKRTGTPMLLRAKEEESWYPFSGVSVPASTANRQPRLLPDRIPEQRPVKGSHGSDQFSPDEYVI